MNPEEILERELERFEGRIPEGTGRFWEMLRRSRVALITLAAGIAFLQLRGLPEEFSDTALDAGAILQMPEDARHVRLVTIGDEEYRDVFGGTSPLNPDKLGELIAAIAGGGASVIVVDLDTSHPMFQGMKAPENAAIIWAAPGRESGHALEAERPLGGRPLAGRWTAALDLIPRDSKGMIRGYARRFSMKNGEYLPSLEFAPRLALAGEATPATPIEADENVRLLDFHYKFYPLEARQVMAKSHLPGWPQGSLSGQVVVLGGEYRAARDVYATPARPMEGSEIVAQGIEAELSGTGIPRANPWFAGLLQLVSGLGLAAIYHFCRLRTALLSSLALIPCLSLAASLILFHRLAMWGALIPIMTAIIIAELYVKAGLYLSLCKKFSEMKKKD